MAERILIVDDDPWILRMVSTLLDKRGFAVSTATDGEEGLRRVTSDHPDLIISDVMMPKMDGWAMVKALRSQAELAFIPVIFLTALSSEEDRMKGFRLGADDYLAKPFRFEELDQRVAQALKKRREAPTTLNEIASQQTVSLSPGASAKPGIAGLLEHLGVSSLLMMIEMERKSGVLKLERPGCTGRVFVRQGRVLAARLSGDRAPEDASRAAGAVYHVLTWTTGKFDFTPGDVDVDEEITESVTGLLMEGARLLDEADR
jgi:CheY-like chemotaxis protein